MTPGDLQKLPRKAPDARLSYGPDPSQYGELRLPNKAGRHPVVVLIHGGCWKAAYSTAPDMAPMADALKADGFATWNIEYRGLGQPGAGWPETFLDVGRGIDHLRVLTQKYPLDLNRVVVVGHSAGGHLAMWAAARSRLAEKSPLYVTNPLPVRGVIDLAGMVDMTDNIANIQQRCQDTVVTAMLGGTEEEVPDHYLQASAMKLLPLRVHQVLVWAQYDDFMPLRLAQSYVNAAVGAGDAVRLAVVPNIGHFELADPSSAAWPHIEKAIRALMKGTLPR